MSGNPTHQELADSTLKGMLVRFGKRVKVSHGSGIGASMVENSSRWRPALLLAVLAVAPFYGFNSTKLVFSWRNPGAPAGQYKNIMVLAMNGNASGRADFEDRMVATIAGLGVQAIPSYSLLPRPEATPIDMKQLRDVVHGQNIDAVLVSRIVRYKKTTSYVSGTAFPVAPYYDTFYGYYGQLYPEVYSPGYLQTDTKAQIETNFYDTTQAEGVLVWTGTSQVVNPHSVKKLVDSIVKEVVQELQKQKII